MKTNSLVDKTEVKCWIEHWEQELFDTNVGDAGFQYFDHPCPKPKGLLEQELSDTNVGEH